MRVLVVGGAGYYGRRVLAALAQVPGVEAHAAGRRDLVIPLALAAVAAGADGLIVECHPDPAAALCDKEQALTRADMA